MRCLLVSTLALALTPGFLGAAPAELPRGNDHFQLGMTRAEVDSVVAFRRLRIVSNGTAFLVCAGGDSAVEYEQYSFFRAPHGMDYLWKVTLGYRLSASTADYAAVRGEMLRLLGEPSTDTWDGDQAEADHRPPSPTQLAVWVDNNVAVRLGARSSGSPDPNADRMMVTWTDRRLQRLIEARRKKDRTAAAQ